MFINKVFMLLFILMIAPSIYAKQVYPGFVNPESAVQSKNGDIYVTEFGERGKDGDGKIKKINANGEISNFATGLNDPRGLIIYKGEIYATDKDVIIKVDMNDGSWEVFSGTMAFPKTPVLLNDIAVTPSGTFYITDSGNLKDGGMVFIMDMTGNLELLMDENSHPAIKAPNGILPLDESRFLMVDFATGELFEGHQKKMTLKKLIGGLGGGDGIVMLKHSVLISDWKNGVLYEYKDGQVKTLNYRFEAAADIAPTFDKKSIIVPDMKAGTVTIIDIYK
ncbi:MAG: SMP-30/gluconolactonase/LRE family protein [Proteobacteria bacterium]|nr:SMP-30/gluconolactonase/LRE family protein [Pseudomonadota bacterium]